MKPFVSFLKAGVVGEHSPSQALRVVVVAAVAVHHCSLLRVIEVVEAVVVVVHQSSQT